MRRHTAALLCFAQLLAAPAARATSSLTATVSSGATDLALDGEGTSSTHIVKVADLSLSTDAAAGFTVYVTSAALDKASGGTGMPFQVVLVEDGAGTPAAAAFTAPAGTTFSFSTSGPGAVEKDLYIKYTPAPLQDPGAYAATINLDIVDR